VYPDLHWDTWIGAGAGLLRVGDASIYFRADVETIAGNTRRAFDAAQVNYHLEPGVRVNLGQEREADLFFHHVSRHVIDTEKTPSVEWNIVGVRGSMSVPRHPVRLTASIGRVVQEAYVHYQWELVGQVEADALRRPWGAVYVTTLGRGVTTETSPASPRSGFFDFLLEGGVRWSRGERAAQLFVAYEHRNDVLVLEPGYKDRALIGFRLGLRSSTPAPWSSTPAP
ncbi:MAG: hypothetical protein ACHQNV_11620, partial [Vicinamibacteria bacterium]